MMYLKKISLKVAKTLYSTGHHWSYSNTFFRVRLCLHPDIGPRLHSFSNGDVAPLESGHSPIHLADKPNPFHTSVLVFNNNTTRCTGSLVTVPWVHTYKRFRMMHFLLHLYIYVCVYICVCIYMCVYMYVKYLIQKSFCLTLIFLVLFLCVMGSSTEKQIWHNVTNNSTPFYSAIASSSPGCICETSGHRPLIIKRAATNQYFVTTGKSTWLSSSKSTYRNDLWPFSSAMRCAEGRERVQLSSLEQAGNSSSMTTCPRGWNLPWRKRRGAVYWHFVSKMTRSEYRSFSEAPPPHHHHVKSLFTHNSHLDYRYFIIKVYSPTQIHLWKWKRSVQCVWYDPWSS